jgi:hypothetical protein
MLWPVAVAAKPAAGSVAFEYGEPDVECVLRGRTEHDRQDPVEPGVRHAVVALIEPLDPAVRAPAQHTEMAVQHEALAYRPA